MKTPIAAILVVALLSCPNVWAWDSDGHMQVAEIAWQHLTSASRARVSTLLRLNPNYLSWIENYPAAKRQQVAFVMAATWPDFIKTAPGYTNDGDVAPPVPASSQNIGYSDHLQHRYWHFIDTPFSTDGTALVQPVAPNAETQIGLFTAGIASDVSDDIKSYDLVWLEHLVGDVHQPLHATSRFSADLPAGDRGGNSVALCASPCRNELHAFWDNVLGTSKSPITAIIAADKLAPAPAAQAAITDDQVWITESIEAAKQFVYVSPVGPGAGPYTLSATYKSQAQIEARIRIELAGIRLANLINAKLRTTLPASDVTITATSDSTYPSNLTSEADSASTRPAPTSPARTGPTYAADRATETERSFRSEVIATFSSPISNGEIEAVIAGKSFPVTADSIWQQILDGATFVERVRALAVPTETPSGLLGLRLNLPRPLPPSHLVQPQFATLTPSLNSTLALPSRNMEWYERRALLRSEGFGQWGFQKIVDLTGEDSTRTFDRQELILLPEELVAADWPSRKLGRYRVVLKDPAGLHFVPLAHRFEGYLMLALQKDREFSESPLPRIVSLYVHAGGSEITPEPIELHSSTKWYRVAISVVDPDSPYPVGASTVSDDGEVHTRMQVHMPTLTLVPVTRTIAGYGLEKVTIDVQVSSQSNTNGANVGVIADGGQLEISTAVLDSTGHGRVVLRSTATGVAKVSPASPYTGPSVEIEFVSPLRLLFLAAAGGLVGAALGRKGRQKWSKALLTGGVTGVLMFIGYTVGFNWLPGGKWGSSLTLGGEAVTFFIGALGALVGVGWLTRMLKKLH